jgi:ubiquinone/menaquinone biosynthesis C-methylase UbiE
VDVLDIDPQNPNATVIGGLRRLDGVASDSYDCAVITQTLHFIDDVDAAIAEIKRVLKPGGTALVTAPFLQKLEKPEWPDYWRFTPLSMRYLFGKHFPSDDLEVRSWGNVWTGAAFWIGLA